MAIRVVPHNKDWAGLAKTEAGDLRGALGDVAVAIHHIGSTSIPGICAKPVLDFLLVVPSLEILDQKMALMEGLGYESMGEYGIPGRRYFRKSDARAVRTHQIHAFAQGDPAIMRHLVFRDYLIAHPEEAAGYSALKIGLAAKHPEDMDAYVEGKDPFIKERIDRAIAWQARRPGETAIWS